jgi:calcineurin-like phosphoesterase family protein
MTYRKVFITSDLHLGHRKIIEYENRPFSDVNEMDEGIINRWNSVVTKNDLVYLLGDIAMYHKRSKLLELLNGLNGDIILVMGNHDFSYKESWLSSCGRFKMVSPYPIIVDNWFILSHEPIYLERNSPFVNIYGHVHGDDRYKNFSYNSACVCVERNDYFPIEFEVIKSKIKDIRDNC